MLSLALFVCIAATFVDADVLGKCPTPDVQKDFQLDKLEGKWYEIESTKSLEKAARKCTSYIVEKKEKNKAGFLLKYLSTVSNKMKSEYSDVTTPKISEPAKLLVSPVKGNLVKRPYPFWVISTDYDTYLVGYTCRSAVIAHLEETSILSRTKTLDDKKKMELYEMLKKRGIDQKNLSEVDHEDKECPQE